MHNPNPKLYPPAFNNSSTNNLHVSPLTIITTLPLANYSKPNIHKITLSVSNIQVHILPIQVLSIYVTMIQMAYSQCMIQKCLCFGCRSIWAVCRCMSFRNNCKLRLWLKCWIIWRPKMDKIKLLRGLSICYFKHTRIGQYKMYCI